MNKKALAILSAGHLITDINQGALPALLPFFKEALNLSYAMAGTILMFGNLTSSVIQPAFGYLSDRRPMKWFLPSAPFIACLGISISGFMSDYYLLLLCVMLSGVGIASFHPEGFKTAHFFTGEKKATGMSIFAVGGNFGIALGPVLSLALVTYFGLKGTLGMFLPGLIMAILFLFSLTWLTTPVYSAFTKSKEEAKKPLSKNQKKSLLLLISVVVVRSWIQLGLVSFIPFYYIDYLKGDPLYAGKLVSTFLMAGAFGTLLGGPMADLWGHKKYLLITLILTFPLLILFYHTSGLVAFIVLGISGMVLISSFAITTLMAQMLLPNYLGMAAGLMIGFAMGAGGIGVTLLGAIADTWGVPMAIKTIFAMPLIAFGLALMVKYPPAE